MAFSFFHQQKPREFTYIPRYYNPENEKDENGNERSEEEKRAKRLENAWDVRRSHRPRRAPQLSIALVCVGVVMLVVFINSKAFVRLFEIFGQQTTPTETVSPEKADYFVKVDSTGTRDTIYNEGIGGMFAHRIDSLALMGFTNYWGSSDAMKKALGDEYEIVKMRMDQMNEEYEREFGTHE